MSRTLALFFSLVLLLSTTPTSAQEPVPVDFPLSMPSADGGEATGPLNCFDHYTFGSVQADLQPSLAQTVPGGTLSFKGDVKNDNPYPLLDGTLYVKIFKRDEGTFAAGDGNEVVDQFVIKDNLTLKPNGTLPVSYDWQVPLYTEGGEYYAAYFFATAKRYNLMGLSFTDDVVGNQAQFTITASSSPIAKLSKVDTTLNGRNHNFAAFPLKFAAGETVTIKTTITNPTNQPKTLPLQWNQYAWDAMNPDNLRFTQTDIVTLAPGETKEVSYEAQSQRESVVYITAVTQDIDAKSILNVRYVREGIEETRINFPGLSAFPLKKDTDTTLFACAHSTNLPIVPGNTLTLSLKDRDGNMIHEYKYEGDIAGAMSGFGEVFKSATNINYATLTATLERNGVMVEQVTQTYDCEAIDPTSCIPEETSFSTWFDFFTTHLMAMIITLLTLIVLGILYFLYRTRRDVPKEGIEMTTPMILIFFAFSALTASLTPVEALATKSTVWSSQAAGVTIPQLWYYWNWGGGQLSANGNTGWQPGLQSNAAAQVTYAVTLKNADTNTVISDGATVPAGTKITYEVNHNNADISWNGTGLSSDSPNGHWTTSAQYPTDSTSGDRVAEGVYTGSSCLIYITTIQQTADVYVPLSIRVPNKNVTLGGTASVIQINPTTWEVTSGGTISVSVVFSQTYGQFYYYYDASLSWCYPGLYKNEIPMTTSSNLTQTCKNVQYLGNRCEYYGDANPPGSVTPYQLIIPQQTITFNLTAVATNNSPASPTISGPTSNTVNTSNTFTIRGTDPDGNNVRYGMDWDNNGTVDQWVPGSGYVSSGTNQDVSRTWSSTGTYTFRALTQDSNGANSVWVNHTITITAAPPITATLTANGSGGPIDVNKNTTITLAWTSANAASCSKWGGTWGSGQGVPLSGSETTVVSQTTTYMVNCGGVQDSVTVNVVNQTPAAPSVAYTSGTLQPNNNVTFTIQGTDPDNDGIYYEIDWDNNGSIGAGDGISPSSGYLSSGTAISATHSWTTSGVKTFQARTVDSTGARSGWTSHQVTLNVPIPATPGSITATCPAPGTNLSVTWSAVSGATSYSYRIDNQSNPWQGTCSPTNPGDYCQDGYGGTSVSVGGIAGSNFNAWVHACNSSGCSAPVAVSAPVSCVQYPNLTQPNVTYTLSSTFNAVTGLYDYVDVTFQTSNNGGSNTLANANYELQFDRARDGYDHTTTGSLGTLTVGQTVNRTERVSGNIPFGNARIRVYADNTNAVTETNEGDNERVLDLTIPPPNPNLALIADRYQVRNGETVTLTWSTGIPYTMNCRVYGPGLDVNPSGPSGSRTTPPINAKSEYTYTCTEPSTNTTFTDTVTVETQGEVQEI